MSLFVCSSNRTTAQMLHLQGSTRGAQTSSLTVGSRSSRVRSLASPNTASSSQMVLNCKRTLSSSRQQSFPHFPSPFADIRVCLGSYRTGHRSMRDSNAEMLGEDVMCKTGPVFGLDEEGELNGSYRPCGHPGVRRTWFRLTLRRMAYARFVRCDSCGLRRGTSL